MPDFFLISGLFLARVIDRDWRTYLDRKVVHFAYFYVLWVTIQFAFKAPGFAAEHGALGVVEALCRGLHRAVRHALVHLPAAGLLRRDEAHARRAGARRSGPSLAALEIAHVQTGWTVIDEFCARFVYFYTGYILADRIFQIAATVQARPMLAVLGLVLWALFNGFYVAAGLDGKPFVSLTLGLIGAVAVVAVSALMAKRDAFAPLRWLGEHTIVVYLAFFLGMAASRSVLLKTGLIPDVGTVALLVTVSGIAVAVALFLAVRAHAAPLPVRAARLGAPPRQAALRAAARRVTGTQRLAAPLARHDPRHLDWPCGGLLHDHFLHSTNPENLGDRRDA